jgi:hypothetical protein
VKGVFIFFSLSLAAWPIVAQTDGTCNAVVFFQQNQGCDQAKRGSKCLQLDIRHSLDKEGKEFVYAWNFGDGVTRQGYLTEYCYQQFGTYQISLDLLDPKTNLVIKNEISTEVTLLPRIEFKTDTLKGENPYLKYDPVLMSGIKVNEVFWRIEDKYYCGELIRPTFFREGLYIVEVGVKGLDQASESFAGCTLIGIFVQPKQ